MGASVVLKQRAHLCQTSHIYASAFRFTPLRSARDENPVLVPGCQLGLDPSGDSPYQDRDGEVAEWSKALPC